MSNLTPLEDAVMAAMVWQMGDSVPDLGAQVASGSVGLRRNTGAGLYAQFNADPNRRTDNPDATGLFGTVHVMVADLPDPIGFQIELRQGRLTALHGQSYGQDTRAIDFSTAPFDSVFVVNPRGESVPFHYTRRLSDPLPAARPAPRPAARALAAHQVSTPPARVHAPPRSHAAAQPRPVPQPARVEPPASVAPSAADMLAALSDPTSSRAGRTALVYVGVYVLAAIFVLFARFVLGGSWIVAFVIAAWALRYLHSSKGRPKIAELTDRLDRQGVFQALKPR